MNHSFMQNTSVFSNIKSAAPASSWKVFKDEEEEETGEEEEEIEEETSTRAKKKRLMHLGSRKTAGAGGCQVDKCVADLTDSKRYHQRHKVCEYHSKAQVVILAGLTQRFCQQCSRFSPFPFPFPFPQNSFKLCLFFPVILSNYRFHQLSEFDDTKRSCRRRLAGHNERRRKHFSESLTATPGHRGSASASGSQMEKKQCRQVDERGRKQISVSENSQNFHIH